MVARVDAKVHMRAVFLLAIVLASCAEYSDGLATERFAGEWMIEQPSHATYEASWYRFHDGGQLEHLRDCAFGGQVPTGFVTDAADSLRCVFGDRWTAADAETIVIDGACDDGIDRDIVLGFPSDTSGNASGQTAIDVRSVGGDVGWLHSPWDWVWHKCDETSCMPTLDACR
jgi:hypothetical protein